MPDAVGAALQHLLGRGQELDLALELAVGLELHHQVLVVLDALRADHHLLGEDLRLQVVVVQDVRRRRRRRTPAQELVALVQRELAALDREAEQDLDVDLVVGGVDARPSCR